MACNKSTLRKKIKKFLKKIPIKDQCLLIIMFMLILQLILNLFSEEALTPEATSIDLIFRTTIASVFGYLLSSKFLNYDFITDCIPIKDEATIRSCKRYDELNEIKILITALITIISITVLIFYRKLSCFHYIEITDNHKAIVVQFKDFISGCVGFLIGSDGKSKFGDDD